VQSFQTLLPVMTLSTFCAIFSSTVLANYFVMTLSIINSGAKYFVMTLCTIKSVANYFVLNHDVTDAKVKPECNKSKYFIH
jgi:hypothetical protein